MEDGTFSWVNSNYPNLKKIFVEISIQKTHCHRFFQVIYSWNIFLAFTIKHLVLNKILSCIFSTLRQYFHLDMNKYFYVFHICSIFFLFLNKTLKIQYAISIISSSNSDRDWIWTFTHLLIVKLDVILILSSFIASSTRLFS